MNSRVVSYDSSLVRLLFTPFRPCNLLTTKTPNNSIHFIKSQLKKKKSWICTVCSVLSGVQRGIFELLAPGERRMPVGHYGVHFACCSSLAWPHMLGLLLFIQNILRSLLASLPAKLTLSHGYRNCLRNCLALRLTRYYRTCCEVTSQAFIPEKLSLCPVR